VSARDEVLARVRTALRDAAAPPPVRRDYRTAAGGPGLPPAELLDLLVDRLVDYRALVRRGGAAETGAMVAAALQARGHAGWRSPAAFPRRGWSGCRPQWSSSATPHR
jgi:L-lactate dehydrogenase complex protein LldG